MRRTRTEQALRVAATVALVTALGAAGVSAYVRMAPDDAAVWHVDPVATPDPAAPHFGRITPGEVRGADPATLARRTDAAMLAMPRTRLLGGSVGEGWMTYVTRSAVMGFPDYTSVRILPDGGGATLAAFARSRYGKSDLGVNAARMDRLRAALAP